VIAYPASRVEYLHDAQVHIGGEPPVGLGLALARRRASFRRAEVQEAEVDRLLQLVCAVSGEEHHGRMRFRHSCALIPIDDALLVDGGSAAA